MDAAARRMEVDSENKHNSARIPTRNRIRSDRYFKSKKMAWSHVLRGLESKGRYQLVFHYNERISQMLGTDPPLPEVVLKRILKEADSGRFGPRGDFTRSTVIDLLRYLNKRYPRGIIEPSNPKKSYRFIVYRERWKSILNILRGQPWPWKLSYDLLDTLQAMHREVRRQFFSFKKTMPLSLLRKGTAVVSQIRHNFIPFNYILRKLLENLGIWDFHWELPIVRSPAKLRVLDDVTEKIFQNIGLGFRRTIPIQRPKLRPKSSNLT